MRLSLIGVPANAGMAQISSAKDRQGWGNRFHRGSLSGIDAETGKLAPLRMRAVDQADEEDRVGSLLQGLFEFIAGRIDDHFGARPGADRQCWRARVHARSVRAPKGRHAGWPCRCRPTAACSCWTSENSPALSAMAMPAASARASQARRRAGRCRRPDRGIELSRNLRPEVALRFTGHAQLAQFAAEFEVSHGFLQGPA